VAGFQRRRMLFAASDELRRLLLLLWSPLPVGDDTKSRTTGPEQLGLGLQVARRVRLKLTTMARYELDLAQHTESDSDS